MSERTPSQFTFDEVVSYLKGLVGREVRVHAWPQARSETGAFLDGAVSVFPAAPPHTGIKRFFFQIGDRYGNGFVLSANDFEAAFIDLFDPESLAVCIKFKETDFVLKIPDDRLTREEQSLPQPEERG